jgi:hypothetical protein
MMLLTAAWVISGALIVLMLRRRRSGKTGAMSEAPGAQGFGRRGQAGPTEGTQQPGP